MIKMVAFDIDGTIAPHHERAHEEVVTNLKRLEAKGITICIISGKPIGYVSGMARQIGLKNPIVSGENGAIIYFGIDYPVSKEIKVSYTPEELILLNSYKEYILSYYEEFVWIQPNEVNFSFFVEDESVKNHIDSYTKKHFSNSNFEYYLHPDGCFDIVLKGINKGFAIDKIKEELNIGYHSIATVGDGSNDVPMFEKSLYPIGINREDTIFKAKTIFEAFEVLVSIINSKVECPKCKHDYITYWSIKDGNRVLAECDKCEHTANPLHFRKLSI